MRCVIYLPTVKILVTVKRVTDYERKVKIASDGSSLDTEGMNYVANPFDEIAVEEAIRLGKTHGGEIVVVSIGSKEATQQIRAGIAMGVHPPSPKLDMRGILVVHDGQLDPDAVARTLQKLVEDEKPDLILMGKQATDDDANQTGQLLAGYLGWPSDEARALQRYARALWQALLEGELQIRTVLRQEIG